MNEFHLLFSVKVSHSYYELLIDPYFSLTATPQTHAIMERFGLRFVHRNGRFEIYAKSGSQIWSILDSSIQEEFDSFDFEINSTSPYFKNYTNLPLNRQIQLFYSSDDDLNQTNQHTVILNPKLEERNAEPKMGQLKIKIEDLKKALETRSEVHFEILFEKRSIFGRYFLINSTTNNIAFVSIIEANGESITFDGPIEGTLITGTMVQIFTSETLIPLKQKPDYRFKLIYRINDQEFTIDLPYPDYRGLELSEIKGETQMISKMYIHV